MLRVGVIGATGYTGSELLRFIFSHGGIELTYVTSHSFAGKTLPEIYPHYLNILEPVCSPFTLEEAAQKTDLVFCALPHGDSMDVVPALLAAGLKVIDLSADFRLTEAALYREWYQREHSAPRLLGKAVYGLPEIYKEEIKNTSFVANPGCYPTPVILGLAPLAERGLVDWETLVVDAKSGTSGAGRVPSQALHFSECTENFRAYKVAGHQHTPEVEQELGRLAGQKITMTFVPHLIPMIRGILSTIYLRLTEKLEEEEILEIYREYYREEKFVRILPAPILPETRNVYGSNYCDLAFKWDSRTGRLIIVAAIDNLVKGAAGQAVQNMNLMLGLEEEQGLQLIPMRP
ncbi:MAG: N-acetyl-gamma-glutamyl-phosphate reductase [Firmicutes bacterium]|nr:N-acetyl-gamma-glutamyl-phosphate reductase [Bacillota bacterium]